MKVNFLFLRAGALLAAAGIVLGALGAHALKALLTESQLVSFETAVRYQMVMAFFFLFSALLPIKENQQRGLFLMALVSVFLFSGSIYILSMQDVWQINARFLGPVTPLGGLAMIAAWIWMPFAVKR